MLSHFIYNLFIYLLQIISSTQYIQTTNKDQRKLCELILIIYNLLNVHIETDLHYCDAYCLDSQQL